MTKPITLQLLRASRNLNHACNVIPTIQQLELKQHERRNLIINYLSNTGKILRSDPRLVTVP